MQSVAAGAWCLSWFALYLEIYRYQHVNLSRLGSVFWPSPDQLSRPGGFVRAVVFCSILAPLAFFTLWAIRRANRPSSPATSTISPTAFIAFGSALAIVGAINQIIRRPPLSFDLTLRVGNGGFIVLGLVVATAGLLLQSRTGDRSTRGAA